MRSFVSLAPGTTFAADYQVLRPLSQGGMGAVYEVYQQSTGAHRALKLMHPDLVADPLLRRRFEQEARVGALIESEHVVQVLAAGVDQATQTPWLVMELLRGEVLTEHLRRHGPPPRDQLREIINQVCHALDAAHRVGVVHRDLKPDNVFVAEARREGVPFTIKVLDFGIAKVMAEARTAVTSALGTPIWMAPEQSQASSAIGPWTDVWAFGLIAFWLLTGHSFWMQAHNPQASLQAILQEILFAPLPRASERATQLGASHLLPAGFDDWFSRCVSRDPQARFTRIGDLRAQLLSVLSMPSASAAQYTVAAPPAYTPQPPAPQASTPPYAPTPPFAQTPAYAPTPPYAAPPYAQTPPYAPTALPAPHAPLAPDAPFVPPPPSRGQPKRSLAPLALSIAGVAAIAAAGIVLHSRSAEPAHDDFIPPPGAPSDAPSGDLAFPTPGADGTAVVALVEASPPEPIAPPQAPDAGPAGAPKAAQAPVEKGALRVVSTPPADVVIVDGRNLGPSPAETSLFPGSHTVVLKRGSKVSRPVQATVKGGYRTTLKVSWE